MFTQIREFFAGKNDWIEVWSDYAIWEGSITGSQRYVFYVIKYSESRNKFKIFTRGKRAKKHAFYGVVALEKLCELQKELVFKNLSDDLDIW